MWLLALAAGLLGPACPALGPLRATLRQQVGAGVGPTAPAGGVWAKLARGEEVVVTTLGGSSAAGGGDVGASHSFGALFVEKMNNALGGCVPGRFVHYNRAQACTNTFWATALVDALLPQSDIVLWEFGLNDGSQQKAAPFMLDHFLRQVRPRVAEVVLVYVNLVGSGSWDATANVRQRWRGSGVSSVYLRGLAETKGLAPRTLAADKHLHPSKEGHRLLADMVALGFLDRLWSPAQPLALPLVREPPPDRCAPFVAQLGKSVARLAWAPRVPSKGLPGTVPEIHNLDDADRLDRKKAAEAPCCGSGQLQLPLSGETLLTWRSDGTLRHTVQVRGQPPRQWTSDAEGRYNGTSCKPEAAWEGCGHSRGTLPLPEDCFLHSYWGYFADWQQVPAGATEWTVCSPQCHAKGRVSWMAAFERSAPALLARAPALLARRAAPER